MPNDYLEGAKIKGTDYDLHDAKLRKQVMLQEDNIPGTTQAITFDDDGNVSTIVHSSGDAAVRTDAFTFEEDTITEVRTLATGESLTIVTNTETLETAVTFAAAG